MTLKRRKFTREFKISVMREMDSGRNVAEISREHTIDPTLLYKWKSQYNRNPVNAFKGNGKVCTLEGQIAEKERLIGKLYAENGFLKKALAMLRERMAENRKTM